MGAFWQFSFVIERVPAERLNEIKEIISDILIEDLTIENVSENLFNIRIWDQRIYASNSFFEWSENELKKKIWEKGYLKFKYGVELASETEPIEFNKNDYKAFKAYQINKNF